MLEAKDLEMIAEMVSGIVTKAIEPVQKNVIELRQDVTELKKDVVILKEDVTVLKEDVSVLKEDVSVLKENVAVLNEDVSVLKKDVAILNEIVPKLQREVMDIRIILENDIKKGINIIGEGHLDLNRNLALVLEIKEERELMKYRIQSLESDMRRVKEKIEIA